MLYLQQGIEFINPSELIHVPQPTRMSPSKLSCQVPSSVLYVRTPSTKIPPLHGELQIRSSYKCQEANGALGRVSEGGVYFQSREAALGVASPSDLEMPGSPSVKWGSIPTS
jgi:hypothetical protein